ncbi:MAG: DNA internalization-related competence protein ComEC/Rec2 [Deltaproteobacteria bacterium]|nr:DNA internalization-related competence protein ComEC/Rec2 [Deltaproteobacteria bacterium]
MKRPLPLILFAYVAGIIAGNYFHLPFSYAIAGILIASLAMAIFFMSGKGKAALVLSPLIFALFGLLYIGRVLSPDFPPNHLIHFAGERKYHLEGFLFRPPEPLPEKTRLYVRAEKIYLEEGSFPVLGDLLLTVKDRQGDLRYGDRVRFISKIYLPRTATNPGAFDYRRFLALQGIWATAYVNDASEIVRMEEGQGNAFFHSVERGREKIRVFLDSNAPPESRGIIKALVLGERGDIGKEVNEKFIVSGVSHILSISGLHVALVAAFFFGATRLILRLFPFLLLRLALNKASALVAIIPVIFYTFIAGLGVAAVRSTIMTLSFLLALLLDREKDLYDALFLAAFLILIFNPAAFFDISFQLSFLSVLAILYLTPRFSEYFSHLKTGPGKVWIDEEARWKRKLLIYLGASFLTSTAAILGTGPVVVHTFNRISLVGFLSNLILVPLMGLGNTLLSLLTGLFVFISHPLAKILTALNVFLMDISLALVDFFSRFPLASKRVTTPTMPEVLLVYGMLIFVANLKRWKRAIHGLIGLGAVFLALQVYGYYELYTCRELRVTFLDVGQGDAMIIRFPQGKIMVIDGGGSPDGNFDPGERIVAPYLWKVRAQTIDYLVNTHPHPDHLQGLLFLLKNFQVGEVWSNGEGNGDLALTEEFLGLVGERLQKMGRGEAPKEIGGVRVEFLHPPLEKKKGPSFQGNDASLVIRLTYSEITFLFAGDVEAPAEEEILGAKSNLQSMVLKAPHHGSKTSSTPQFVEKVRPEFVVFTVKAGGRHWLPHPTVLERYEGIGGKVFRTDRDGAVTFITDGRDLRVQTFLKQNARSKQ